jgi:Ca2+-binding RTX toxin-like protein
VSNQAPVLDASGGSLTYTENQVASAIDAVLTVSDVDSANLAGATVAITSNFQSGQDVLGFANQNGISGSYNAGTGVLTLSGSSSVANYQTALRSVTYFDISDNPSGATRTISYQVDDGAGVNHASNVVTAAVTVTPVNDAPLANAAGGGLSYTENQAASAIDTVLTVSDVDSTNLAGATVAITGNFQPGQDVLGFANQNGISGSYNAGTGVLTLSGSSSVANYQTALRSVTYFDSSDNPSGATRTVIYQVDDGAAVNHASNVVTATVSVSPVNDAPVNTVPGAQTVNDNQDAAILGVSVADLDASTLRVTLSAQGQLTLGTTAGLTFSTGDGIADSSMTFQGSKADVNAALGGLHYVVHGVATPDTITLTTSDLGATGSGGTLTDTDTIVVNILGVIGPGSHRTIDFGADGKSDLLWRNSDGTVVTWQMNGAQATSNVIAGGPVPSSWNIVDAHGDYNGDGKSDVLWRNSDGTVVTWHMNGATPTANVIAGGPVPLSYSIVDGHADYNGDGKSDILWRNSDGTVVTWQMDGTQVTSNVIAGGPVPLSWTITDAAEIGGGILGDSAGNTLIGTVGRDTLYGKGGNDSLSGGAGADRFVFDMAPNGATNMDTLSDFVSGSDKLLLSQVIFPSVPQGPLAAQNFVAEPGAVAHDANDFILYNTTTGAVSYDQDGSGAQSAVTFATLANHPLLAAQDIQVGLI